MKVDCHMHSLYSDGVCTMEEIISLLQQEHVSIFSITDHDTVDGIKEASLRFLCIPLAILRPLGYPYPLLGQPLTGVCYTN